MADGSAPTALAHRVTNAHLTNMIWKLARYAVFSEVVYMIIESGMAENNPTLTVGIGAVLFTAVFCVPLDHLELWLRRRRMRREGYPEEALPQLDVADSVLTKFVEQHRAERMAAKARKRRPE